MLNFTSLLVETKKNNKKIKHLTAHRGQRASDCSKMHQILKWQQKSVDLKKCSYPLGISTFDHS